MRASAGWLVVIGIVSAPVALSSETKVAEDKATAVSFRAQVAPVLVRACLGCHNDAKAEGGLNLATVAGLRKGGKASGTDVVIPGDASASELVESVKPDASPRMPYKLPPLSEADVRTLAAWVDQGAKFDGPSETETKVASLVDPLKNLPVVKLKAEVSDPVTSLAFSPDGARLAAAVGSRVVLLDAVSGKVVTAFARLAGPVNSIRYTPDGATLVAAGGRAGMFGAVATLDVKTGKTVAEARGHSDTVVAADLSPDGKTLATAGYDRDVLLWSLAPLRVVKTLRDHTDAVYAVAFAPDGKTLASAGADRTVKIWDLATGARLVTLSDATAELYAVAFDASGKTVLAAGVDKTVRAWSLDEGGTRPALVNSAFAHAGPVLRMVVSKDRATLVTSGEDRDVKLWDLASLTTRRAFAGQPDWPQSVALNPDASRLAVGRYDGSIAVYETATGKPSPAFAFATSPAPATAETKTKAKPELFRNAALDPISPRGAARGTTVRLTLTGTGVGRATEVTLDDPALKAKVVAAKASEANRLSVDLAIDPAERVGVHRIGVVTPLGVPAARAFVVDPFATLDESEPNDDPKALKPVALPVTLVGAINAPGDVDHLRFAAKHGQELVFRVTAKPLDSSLLAVLRLLDESGATVAESTATDDGTDTVLAVAIPRDGLYALRVADADYGGSPAHFYRVSIGPEPFLTSSFPLGVAKGATTPVHVEGMNLGALHDVPVSVGPDVPTPRLVPIAVGHGVIPVNERLAVVAEGPQAVESEPNDDPAHAGAVATPGGVSGRVDREADIDLYRFMAKKGVPLVVEVFGRRVGSPIDSALEILDAEGRPVPMAVLRPVAQTEIAFRDHAARVPGMRLTKWNNLATNDVVLVGREVTRIFTLPRNLDDDCQFASEQGRRIGLLGTTPEYHAMGQPLYKVEVHPPGAVFPPGGVRPVTLFYRNDDASPSTLKDSSLRFDPPSDGTYLARVSDARGAGGPAFGYHLVVRGPRPDFEVSPVAADVNVPRGGTALINVTTIRRDGFEGPIAIAAEHLPPGIHATPTVIERYTNGALIGVTADPTAAAFSLPGWTLRARAAGGASAPAISREVDPGGPSGGRVTVVDDPNLSVTIRPSRIVLRPGGEATATLSVTRGPGFAGRVPVEVRNLPHGVKVLNIGLNGVPLCRSRPLNAPSRFTPSLGSRPPSAPSTRWARPRRPARSTARLPRYSSSRGPRPPRRPGDDLRDDHCPTRLLSTPRPPRRLGPPRVPWGSSPSRETRGRSHD